MSFLNLWDHRLKFHLNIEHIRNLKRLTKSSDELQENHHSKTYFGQFQKIAR